MKAAWSLRSASAMVLAAAKRTVQYTQSAKPQGKKMGSCGGRVASACALGAERIDAKRAEKSELSDACV